MKNRNKSAKSQLLALTTQLKEQEKTLNCDECVIVLNEVKNLCTNQQLIDIVLKSLKVLNHTKLKKKHHLTNREKQVLTHIGIGLKNETIATELNLSKSTIETHRKNIRKKLKLNGEDNLFAYAFLFNLLNQKLIKDDNFWFSRYN